MTPRLLRTVNVWLLLDDRMGNREQCLAVGEALGLPFESKEVRYNSLAALPNRITDIFFDSVDKKRSDQLIEPFPDLLVSAGRRLAPVAQKIKKNSKNVTKIVHIMWPSITKTDDFDLLVVPNHDIIPNKTNITRIIGAPHRLYPARKNEVNEVLMEKLLSLPSPYIAVLVGGSTKSREFSVRFALDLARLASQMANAINGSLLILTSRRTSNKVTSAVIKNITAPQTHFIWGTSEPNPYKIFLEKSDAIIVTGDSMSMCSEACFSEKPVYIFAPEKLVTKKHKRFHKELYQSRFAQPLIEFAGRDAHAVIGWSHTPLNSALEIATIIKEKILDL